MIEIIVTVLWESNICTFDLDKKKRNFQITEFIYSTLAKQAMVTLIMELSNLKHTEVFVMIKLFFSSAA